MKRILIVFAAAAALALPAAASAHGYWWHSQHSLLTRLSGTGTSFGASSASAKGSIVAGALSGGTFSASLSSDWTHAATHTGDHGTLSCAPSTLSLTLTSSTSSANTVSTTVSGKTCSFTKTDGTVFRGFFGKGAVVGTGTLAGVGGMGHAFLMQKADGTVKGAVFAGMNSVLSTEFTAREHDAALATGGCDGNH